MTYQTEIDEKLLRYFLEKENPRPKEKLKKKYSKDKKNNYNKTYENYFHLSYNSLLYLNLINEEGKLNSKYENIRVLKNDNKKIKEEKKKKIDFIFSLIIDTVQRYRLRLFQALEIQKGIDNLWIAQDEEVRRIRREITDEESKKLLDDISTVIHDLLDRFINNSTELPNQSFELITKSSFQKETSMNVILFKNLLFLILDGNKEVIYDSEINAMYNGMIEALEWELSKSSKSNIKRHVIKVFKLLEIFETEKAPYKIVKITDTEWKMNALSKIDSIKDIVKSISNRHEIPKEDREMIMKIFNFSN
jgi:hypothetical protein